MGKASGFDNDGVASLLPLGKNQLILTKQNDRFLKSIQQSVLFQRAYNRLLRVPNLEIREAMNELKRMGKQVVIISASSKAWYKTLPKWLRENGFLFDDLLLREDTEEDFLVYKKRLVFEICNSYIDDTKAVVDFLKESNNTTGCRVLHYQKQKKEEILSFYTAKDCQSTLQTA